MYQYDIRVRNTVYLWGSDQMTNSNAHGVLHLHNDVRGDTVTLSRCADGGADVKIGPFSAGPIVHNRPAEWQVRQSNLRSRSEFDCDVLRIRPLIALPQWLLFYP